MPQKTHVAALFVVIAIAARKRTAAHGFDVHFLPASRRHKPHQIRRPDGVEINRLRLRRLRLPNAVAHDQRAGQVIRHAPGFENRFQQQAQRQFSLAIGVAVNRRMAQQFIVRRHFRPARENHRRRPPRRAPLDLLRDKQRPLDIPAEQAKANHVRRNGTHFADNRLVRAVILQERIEQLEGKMRRNLLIKQVGLEMQRRDRDIMVFVENAQTRNRKLREQHGFFGRHIRTLRRKNAVRHLVKVSDS